MDRPGIALAVSGQIANGRIRKALAVHGLKPAHGYVLMLLSDRGAMNQQAVLEALDMDPSMLVAILNDLEHDQLAGRRRDPADRRRHIVEISDRGSALATDIRRAIAAVEAELFADLDDSEVATLHGLLGRVKVAPDDDSCTGDH